MFEAFIVSAVRTAGGRRGGKLAGWHPVELAAQVINAVVARSGADPELVEDVFLGCVSQIGEQSTNVARNAVLASVLPQTVPGTSIDRQCGSSQQAVHFAAQAVMSGAMDMVIAGGVESMTRVPMGSPSALAQNECLGYYQSRSLDKRYGSSPFSQFQGAEAIAKKYGLEKDELDAYALSSHQRAISATRDKLFEREILAIPILSENGESTGDTHVVDEGIRFDASLEKIQSVKLLREDGLLTAASASQMCDGASAVLVVNERGLKVLGVRPMARIHHMSVLGDDPVVMLEAPIPATARALKKTGLRIEDIDLYEVNEAFASIPLAWSKAVGAPLDRMNVHGGAIALGHPLGASGTKLMTTLLHALEQRSKRWGLQTMCEGGGMANVTIIERL
jgi:acetyl-CoA C-acetyltransferase